MSDQPSIIRQDAQHTVTVTEGALVATSKPSDPHAPVVRQNLAGEEGGPGDTEPNPEGQLPPPPASADQSHRGLVFERSVAREREDYVQATPAVHEGLSPASAPPREPEAQESSAALAVPAALTPAPAGAETPVEQFLREKRLAVPVDGASLSEPASEGPAFERALRDRYEALPGAQDASSNLAASRSGDSDSPLPAAPAHSERTAGPILDRSLQDRFETVAAPPAGTTEPASGPVLERAYEDRRVAVPDVPQRAAGAVQVAPREGSRRPAPPPAPAPVPTAQAQQVIAETAQDVQQKIEETIGAADQQWVEMDFPARVIKLKIQNDRVRTQLDQLEEMAQSHERASASA